MQLLAYLSPFFNPSPSSSSQLETEGRVIMAQREHLIISQMRKSPLFLLRLEGQQLVRIVAVTLSHLRDELTAVVALR